MPDAAAGSVEGSRRSGVVEFGGLLPPAARHEAALTGALTDAGFSCVKADALADVASGYNGNARRSG